MSPKYSRIYIEFKKVFREKICLEYNTVVLEIYNKKISY